MNRSLLRYCVVVILIPGCAIRKPIAVQNPATVGPLQPGQPLRFAPIVTQRMTEYPQIRFHPGDVIAIQASGCVDIDGKRHTLKRYVNPSGENSDRLYHGLVWIPGVTPGLVRIAGIQNRSIQVPADFKDPSQLFLRLGYEDEEYDDNKLDPPDPKTTGQCQSEGPAQVQITVTNSPPPAVAAAPLDLVWANRWDDNLLPKHPLWSVTAAAYDADPSSQPAAPDAGGMCDQFRVVNGEVSFGTDPSKPCTSQSPSIDHPGTVALNNGICHLTAIGGVPLDLLRGHVNWFPATYSGVVNWEEHTTDGDYNLRLTPDARPDATHSLSQSILTTGNDQTGKAIEIEFSAGETIQQFETDWWTSFRDAVDAELGGESKFIHNTSAIVTGLVGVDNEHGAHAELHPVFAIAMKVEDSPSDETWAMFVRNWGNEGFCSQDIHYLDTPGNKYTFRLPWNKNATGPPTIGVSVFKSHFSRAPDPVVTPLKDIGVLVSFTLPAPEKGGLIEGELHLRWPGAPMRPAPPPALLAPISRAKERIEHAEAPQGEETLGQMLQELTREQKLEFRRLTDTAAKRLTSPSSAKDLQKFKIEQDRLRIKALCQVLPESRIKYPGVCKSQ